MGIEQFANTQNFRVLNLANETADLCDMTLASSIELSKVQLFMRKTGTSGSESFKVQVFGSSIAENPIGESDSVSLADIESVAGLTPSSRWYADVIFPFSTRIPLTAGIPYYFKLKASSYTPTLPDTFWVAWVYDVPGEEVNTLKVAGKYGPKIRLIGLQ